MKKLIGIILILVMVLCFTACGDSSGGANGGPSIEKELTSGTWTALLDYSLRQSREMNFKEDGSGELYDAQGFGGDIEWTVEEENVRVTYKYDGGMKKYNFAVEQINDYTRLYDKENNFVFVLSDNYDKATTDLKAEYRASAQELDWKAASDARLANKASFAAEYCGKLWKCTAQVKLNGIGNIYFDINKGISSSSTVVYVSQSDLAKLSAGDEVTIVGILEDGGDKLVNAFLS